MGSCVTNENQLTQWLPGIDSFLVVSSLQTDPLCFSNQPVSEAVRAMTNESILRWSLTLMTDGDSSRGLLNPRIMTWLFISCGHPMPLQQQLFYFNFEEATSYHISTWLSSSPWRILTLTDSCETRCANSTMMMTEPMTLANRLKLWWGHHEKGPGEYINIELSKSKLQRLSVNNFCDLTQNTFLTVDWQVPKFPSGQIASSRVMLTGTCLVRESISEIDARGVEQRNRELG